MNDEHREDSSVTGWSSRGNGTSTATAEPIDRRWFEDALRAQGFLVEAPPADEIGVAEPAPDATDLGTVDHVVADAARAVAAQPAAAVEEASVITGPGQVEDEHAGEPWDLQPSPAPLASVPEPAAMSQAGTTWPRIGDAPSRIPSVPTQPATADTSAGPVSPTVRLAVAPTTLPEGRAPVPTPELAARLARSTTRPAPAAFADTAPVPMVEVNATTLEVPTTVNDPAVVDTADGSIGSVSVTSLAAAERAAVEPAFVPAPVVAPGPAIVDDADAGTWQPVAAAAPMTPVAAEAPVAEIVGDAVVEIAGEPAVVPTPIPTVPSSGTAVHAADPWTLPALQADLAAERRSGSATDDDHLAPFVVAAATAPVVVAASPAAPAPDVASPVPPVVVADDPAASTAEAIARQEADLQAQGVVSDTTATDTLAAAVATDQDAMSLMGSAPLAATAVPAAAGVVVPMADDGPIADTDVASPPADDQADPDSPAAVAASPAASGATAVRPAAGIAAIAHRPPAATAVTDTPVEGGDSDLWGLVNDPRKAAADATTTARQPASSRLTTLILTVFVALVVVVLVLGFLYLLGQLL